MDQEAMHQNMNSNMEENWDVDQEVYETLNKGTILEPRNLWIDRRMTWRTSSVLNQNWNEKRSMDKGST